MQKRLRQLKTPTTNFQLVAKSHPNKDGFFLIVINDSASTLFSLYKCLCSDDSTTNLVV